MNDLFQILSLVLKEESNKFENLEGLYGLCKKKGYKGTMSDFEFEYQSIVEKCSNTLKESKISDSDLELVSGGTNANINLKSSIATIMATLSLSSSISSVTNASSTNVVDDLKEIGKSVSTNINKWSQKASNMSNGAVLGSVLGATTIGITGAGLLMAPINKLISKHIKNKDIIKKYENTYNLVVLVTSDQFNELKDNKKLKMVKDSYLELGVKDIPKDLKLNIKAILEILMVNLKNKIDSLNNKKNAKLNQDEAIFLRLLSQNIIKKHSDLVGQASGVASTAPHLDVVMPPSPPPPPSSAPPPPLKSAPISNNKFQAAGGLLQDLQGRKPLKNVKNNNNKGSEIKVEVKDYGSSWDTKIAFIKKTLERRIFELKDELNESKVGSKEYFTKLDIILDTYIGCCRFGGKKGGKLENIEPYRNDIVEYAQNRMQDSTYTEPHKENLKKILKDIGIDIEQS